MAVRRLTEERVSFEAIHIFIRAKPVDERQRVRCRLHPVSRKRLHAFGMDKDVLKLGSVFCELLVGQSDPGEIGNFGDVDFNWHANDGTDAHEPSGGGAPTRQYRAPMLPWPSRHELRRRLPRLTIGLILFAVGVSMQVIAGLGLSPWFVLHQGVALRAGIQLGTSVIIIGVVVLLLWVPLKQRFGLGTILNVLVIGFVVDICLWLGPDSVDSLAVRVALLVGGIVILAVGSGFYIGAGLGPGPRDGLMTGLARLGINIGLARFGIEFTVLVLGWLLGGTVGVGTALFVFAVGPLVALFLPRLIIEPIK